MCARVRVFGLSLDGGRRFGSRSAPTYFFTRGQSPLVPLYMVKWLIDKLKSPHRSNQPGAELIVVALLGATGEILGPRSGSFSIVLRRTPIVGIATSETSNCTLVKVKFIQFILTGQKPVVIDAVGVCLCYGCSSIGIG